MPGHPEETQAPYLEEESQHEGQRPETEAGAYLLRVHALVGVQTLLLLHVLQLRGEGWVMRRGPRRAGWRELAQGTRTLAKLGLGPGLGETPHAPSPVAAGPAGARSLDDRAGNRWAGSPDVNPAPACLFRT